MKRIFTILLIAVLAIVSLPVNAFCTDTTERHTVKVAFPIQKGLTEKSENGVYSGYTYDYLMEIARFTGWSYEFVELQGDTNDVLKEMLSMLKDGKIDIIGSMNYSEALAKQYDYGSISYGMAHMALCVSATASRVTEYNYMTEKNIKVALVKTAEKSNTAFQNFCEMNRMSVDITYYENTEECLNALNAGKVEAMLSKDIAVQEGLRSVALFSPSPYYFAVTKGNDHILSELNAALARLSTANSGLQRTLYEKYFETPRKYQLVLTSEDKELIKNAPPLRIGMLGDHAPYQSYNKTDGYKGITMDLVEKIHSATGLNYQYILKDTTEEMAEGIENGEIDVVAAMPYSYSAAEALNVLMTKPLVSSSFVVVTNVDFHEEKLEPHDIALPYEMSMQIDASPDNVIVKSTKEALEYVSSGKVAAAYVDSYLASNELSNRPLPNVTTSVLQNTEYSICFGLSKQMSRQMMALFDKIVLSLNPEEISSIVYKNTIIEADNTVFGFVKRNPVKFIGFLVITVLIIITSLVFIIVHEKRMQKMIKENNTCYMELCDICGEIIFQYDYHKNKFSYSGSQSEQLFSKNQCVNYPVDYVPDKEKETALKKILYDIISRRLSGDENAVCEFLNGEERWINVTYRIILDNKRKVIFCIGKITDINEKVIERQDLVLRAEKDVLTGAYNSGSFRNMAAAYFEDSEEDINGALIVMDIDNFKGINDRFGHCGGDKILTKVGQMLIDTFVNMPVGRIGGDEFMILMRNITDKDVISKYCKKLQQSGQDIAGKHTVTFSMGILVYNTKITFNEAYQAADNALYITKKHGKNNYNFYN